MSERILIVSDTHGRLNYFKEMLARTGSRQIDSSW